MTVSITATLGTFIFSGVEGSIPGSDSYWDVTPSDEIAIPLGATRPTITHLGDSATRHFSVHLTPDRFSLLKALQGTTADFTDWYGDARSVYVRLVKHNPQGSRPFLFTVDVELISQ